VKCNDAEHANKEAEDEEMVDPVDEEIMD